MVRNPTLAQKDLAEAHLAVAGIYDSRGLVHQAFPYFAAGNEIKSRRSQYRPEIHTQFTDRIVSVFDGTLFDRMRPFGVHNRLPLFVIGMPRSGTTLVEQILASHSRIVGAGELHDIGNIAGTIRQRAQVPEFFPESTLALSSVMAPEFAESYLERISGLGPDASRVTDKMPDNYQFLGLIALLLPDARIIHCRRDPLDTCLSCYLTNFAGEMGFARNLAHLGACYRDYERLMDHWRRVLPLPILDVQYEELVRDQERVSRDMVNFAGLEWEESCLEFYRTKRPVSTASTQQVRRPIYTSSIGRAQAYADYLAPLIEALGEDR